MQSIDAILKTIKNIEKKGKTISMEELISILNATKHITDHKGILNALIGSLKNSKPDTHDKTQLLTKKELEVLQYIGEGKSSLHIAQILNINVSTVETHRKNIRKKLELRLQGKGKLIEYAILENLYELPTKTK